jgi:uncharacterized protein with ParB-like and HNH nuclease domain
MPEIVKSLITPNDKTLRSIFEAAKCYHVDIYQREYKWTEENVKTLLNDIELRFNLCKRTQIEPAKIQQDVIVNFEPYFLNTFLVNATTENVSIVDGQQRLTTFLIILIKLYKLVKEVTSNQAYNKRVFLLLH